MTVVGYLYRNAMDNGDLGLAATVGWVLTALILGPAGVGKSLIALTYIREAVRRGVKAAASK